MDLIAVVKQLLKVLMVLLPFIILIFVIKTSWFKGLVGEFIINFLAKLYLNKNEYHLIKKVTLPTKEGSTRIDHVIVSRYGVFVVETKNMKGWIYGDPRKITWIQKITKQNNKFQNPLIQNFRHVKSGEIFRRCFS